MKRTTFRIKYFCVDGPMKGQHIYLHGDATTLAFELKGHKGRYVPNGIASVRWEAAQ